MLSDEEMQAHLESLKLPQSGIDYVMHVRASQPARRVEARYLLNTLIRYASRLMKRVIQGEAFTTAGYRILQHEFDKENVLEYWDETSSISVEGTRKDGRHLRTTYTPDILVIRKDSVVAEQPKSIETLRELCKSRPLDWQCVDGTYHYKPAENEFGPMGIKHKVISSDCFNAVHADNLILLLHSRLTSLGKSVKKRLPLAHKLLRQRRVASMTDLARSLRLRDMTPLLHWIDQGLIKVDLTSCLLSQPNGAFVALRKRDLDDVRHARRVFVIDPKRDDAEVKAGRVSRDKDAVDGLKRHRAITGEITKNINPRTLRHWKSVLKKNNGDINALKSKYWKCGKPGLRVDKRHIRFMSKIISKYYATEKRPTERGAYRYYKLSCSNRKQRKPADKPVVFNTFRKIRKQLNCAILEQGRGGRRAANAAKRPTNPKVRALSATRPFQKGHIDHYLCKQWVVVARSNKLIYTARPWLTLMTDEFSGKILGAYLGLAHPSRKSVAAVLRDCVRRHKRLPEWIMTDQGADFRSTFYESALAELGIHKQERPTSAPRFGGPHERVFGTIAFEVFAGMSGSMLRSGKVRAVSASHHGRRTAKHSLEDLYSILDNYFFSEYNAHPRGENTKSPDVLCDEGLAQFSCSGVKFHYDFAFLVSTAIPAPSTQKRGYKVDPARGVKIYGKWYRCPELSAFNPDHVSQIRVEPFDDNRIYMLLHDKWVIAYNSNPLPANCGDPITRLFDSIRHLDGRAALAAAKEARELSLAKRALEIDTATKTKAKRKSVRDRSKSMKSGYTQRKSRMRVPATYEFQKRNAV